MVFYQYSPLSGVTIDVSVPVGVSVGRGVSVGVDVRDGVFVGLALGDRRFQLSFLQNRALVERWKVCEEFDRIISSSEVIMQLNVRPWLDLILPFLIGFGMAIGALIGSIFTSDAALQEGPAGDAAGALGALMIVICIISGFGASTLSIIAAKFLRRGSPDRIILRIGLSLLLGGAIGVLGPNAGKAVIIFSWSLLICGPAAIAWIWRIPLIQTPQTHDREY